MTTKTSCLVPRDLVHVAFLSAKATLTVTLLLQQDGSEIFQK